MKNLNTMKKEVKEIRNEYGIQKVDIAIYIDEDEARDEVTLDLSIDVTDETGETHFVDIDSKTIIGEDFWTVYDEAVSHFEREIEKLKKSLATLGIRVDKVYGYCA